MAPFSYGLYSKAHGSGLFSFLIVMEPILSVRELRTSFFSGRAETRAVDGLSYELEAGRTLAIVGESGSGKSAHALSLLRLLPRPQGRILGGEVLFAGKDLMRIPESSMRRLRGDRISMIFQEPMSALNPVSTIGDQIAEAILAHRPASRASARAKAEELLDLVGIGRGKAGLDAYPHEFSGGMRQRAMIAMAISCGPDVLVADEPTTALDVTIQAQILDLLGDMQARLGMAMVLITHNLGVVARMADRVVVMYAGRKVEEASARDIFAAPAHPYTRALLESIPPLSEKLERLKVMGGHPPEPGALLDRSCPFEPRCPEAFEKCRRSDPPLFDLGGRFASCWKARPGRDEI